MIVRECESRRSSVCPSEYIFHKCRKLINMGWPAPDQGRAIARRIQKGIAISLIMLGAGWFIFEFAAQYVYLRPEFRQPQPDLGYVWATPMKGRYAYLSHAESLLEIYMPTAFGLFFVGALWLERLRKTQESKKA